MLLPKASFAQAQAASSSIPSSESPSTTPLVIGNENPGPQETGSSSVEVFHWTGGVYVPKRPTNVGGGDGDFTGEEGEGTNESIEPLELDIEHDHLPVGSSDGHILLEHQFINLNFDVKVTPESQMVSNYLNLSPGQCPIFRIDFHWGNAQTMMSQIAQVPIAGYELTGMESSLGIWSINEGMAALTPHLATAGMSQISQGIDVLQYGPNSALIRIKRIPLKIGEDYYARYALKFPVPRPEVDVTWNWNYLSFEVTLVQWPHVLTGAPYSIPFGQSIYFEKEEIPSIPGSGGAASGARMASSFQPVKAFSIHPNPVSNVLVLNMNEELLYKGALDEMNFMTVEAMNGIGQVVEEWTFSRDALRQKLDVSGLTKGYYFLRIQTDKGFQTLPFQKTAN